MEKKHLVDKQIVYIFCFLFLVLGIVLGVLLKIFFPNNSDTPFTQTRESGYEFINPLIDFELVDSAKVGEIANLEKSLKKYSEQKTNSGEATNISIYYKDLNSGAWIGVNEQEQFTPASLLKLPLMIGYYKLAETQPDILDKKITYKAVEDEASQDILPKENLTPGQQYTAEELIEHMIIYSDNQAALTLYNNIDTKYISSIYTDLGISLNIEQTDDFMTVKEYASFFRILYNASYLSKDMSTKALELLSKADFTDGLKAGVPQNITISHKFGERAYIDENEKQLHDCGIVYHPDKPYLLCVMTRGTDFTTLEGIIKDISSTVYKSVNGN